jgi:hypothetical protein
MLRRRRVFVCFRLRFPGIPQKKDNSENYLSGKRKVKDKFLQYFFIASFSTAVLINKISA